MSDASKEPQPGRPRSAALQANTDEPVVFGSAMAAAARRAAGHFSGRDAEGAEAPDAIELWGRRIGRALSLIGCVGLGVYLYLTYLR